MGDVLSILRHSKKVFAQVYLSFHMLHTMFSILPFRDRQRTSNSKVQLLRTFFLSSGFDSLFFYFHCFIVFAIVLHNKSGLGFLKSGFLKAGPYFMHVMS